MREAVIAAVARSPFAKSWKGSFNMCHGADLGGHVIAAVVERAQIDAAQIEDVILGCANPEGANGGNIARQSALRAGLPVSVPGMTVNRFCSSGLQAIALAAQRIASGEGEIFVAGGPGHPRNPRRPTQRGWRRHCAGPSLRRQRRSPDRSRSAGGSAAWGQVCSGYYVYRRRDGCSRLI